MADPAPHPDHAVEQEYLRRARAALEAMQERAALSLEYGERAVREENTVESRIARAHLIDRTAALALGEVALCFGRIDSEDSGADGAGPVSASSLLGRAEDRGADDQAPDLTGTDDPGRPEDPGTARPGEHYYVGRRHIEDTQNNPVVVDWRAPVAIPFYRATAADPLGLARRRRFSCEGDTLTAIFDEHLDDPDSMVAAGLPDPLLAEVERSRTGEMGDIVATIAAVQDEIIRAELNECLIVQGGPGTGKTAVGLHRAAFLLFEHRADLESSRVLVVGPNPLFLRYIANVLPSLGETAVSQATLRSLLEGKYRVRGTDTDEVAELKGDSRMASVVRGTALDQLSTPDEPVSLGVGLRSITITPDQVEMAQKTALGRNLPLNDGRGVYSELLLREARAQLIDRDIDEVEAGTTISRLRGSDDFKKLINRTWPSLAPVSLVQSMLGNRARLKRASAQLLSDAERKALHRPAAKKRDDEQWTEADLPLLDEAQQVCAGVITEYGHVVVDEAQDLSAMAMRVIGRRARNGSLTVLGDIAQATAVGAQHSWEAVIEALALDTPTRTCELTIGYRVPGPILDFANQLLPVTAPDITPSTSVRHRGEGPTLVPVEDSEIASAAVAATRELAKVATTIAVIAGPGRVDELYDALAAADLEVIDTRTARELSAPVSVVDARAAKGLEFDAVVVVEPAEFAVLPNGLRLLYVALTRAVQRLSIIHHQALPAPLAE